AAARPQAQDPGGQGLRYARPDGRRRQRRYQVGLQGPCQEAPSRCKWRRQRLGRAFSGGHPGISIVKAVRLLLRQSHATGYLGACAAFARGDVMSTMDLDISNLPDTTVSVREVFGIDTDLRVPAYSEADAYVPDLDPDYLFDRETTLAILAGFAHNRRVMVSGYHGTGKSTHIEQVAARLNWPCVRVNLDSHVSRIDLVGKDAIVVREGMQVTEFKDGILPWAYQHNVALVFDEYDAGRPDVMFVIQRVLESSGRLTLLDQSRVIRPHPAFRLFATANTVGLGDTTGLYHGTQQINQAQ